MHGVVSAVNLTDMHPPTHYGTPPPHTKLIHPKHVSYKDNTLPDATVMTATDQVEAVLVHGEAGDTVQVSHHTVNHLEQKIFAILYKNICHLTWPVVLS